MVRTVEIRFYMQYDGRNLFIYANVQRQVPPTQIPATQAAKLILLSTRKSLTARRRADDPQHVRDWAMHLSFFVMVVT